MLIARYKLILIFLLLIPLVNADFLNKEYYDECDDIKDLICKKITSNGKIITINYLIEYSNDYIKRIDLFIYDVKKSELNDKEKILILLGKDKEFFIKIKTKIRLLNKNTPRNEIRKLSKELFDDKFIKRLNGIDILLSDQYNNNVYVNIPEMHGRNKEAEKLIESAVKKREHGISLTWEVINGDGLKINEARKNLNESYIEIIRAYHILIKE